MKKMKTLIKTSYGALIFMAKAVVLYAITTLLLKFSILHNSLSIGRLWKKWVCVDYGRYNTTFNPEDLYKFRTPSLHNVSKTFPYGHCLYSLTEAVQAHFDPLLFFDENKNSL